MKTLAAVTTALGLLGVIAAANPAAAAMGQCFDAYGRPFGPPHSTDNPPYGMMCQAYRVGGHCTHVDPGWAEANCGVAPRRYYYDKPEYRSRRNDQDWRYRNDWQYPGRSYEFSPGSRYESHPQPNTAR